MEIPSELDPDIADGAGSDMKISISIRHRNAVIFGRHLEFPF
jgi:hypothetical protein